MNSTVFSLVVCSGTFVLLGGIALWIRLFKPKEVIPSDGHKHLQTGLAFLACLYALWCAYRLYELLLTSPRPALDQSLLEVMAISAFWFIAPPAWFFVEYFAVEKKVIRDFGNSEEDLKRTKDYADYASKIWAAVIALLFAWASLKK